MSISRIRGLGRGPLKMVALVVSVLAAAALAATGLSVTALSAPPIASTTPAPTTARLFDFESKEPRWTVINDGVMGGVSQSSFVAKLGVATFAGRVRLENNGGFASVRSPLLALSSGDPSTVFQLRARGDGLTYQFTVKTETGWFWAAVTPKKGAWTNISIPFEKLIPKSRFGETIDGDGLTSAADIESIGFLIGNKREQRFSLALDWVELR